MNYRILSLSLALFIFLCLTPSTWAGKHNEGEEESSSQSSVSSDSSDSFSNLKEKNEKLRRKHKKIEKKIEKSSKEIINKRYKKALEIQNDNSNTCKEKLNCWEDLIKSEFFKFLTQKKQKKSREFMRIHKFDHHSRNNA